MIYLIAQMFVALALAGILGAAIGWLIHRATYARRLNELRHALARAQNQVAHAESEVTMLSDDYDEMQRRSKTEISALRAQTQEIPELNSNLEKSQLLVRQMMQKHESKVRDLSTENSTLSARLKSITDREQAYDKVKVELDNIRKQKMANNRPSDSAETVGISEKIVSATALNALDLDGSSAKIDHSEAATTIDPGNDTNTSVNDSNDSIEAIDDLDLDDSIDVNELDESAKTDTSEALDATVASGPADEFINQLNDATRLPISDARTSGSWASAPLTIDADRKDDPVAGLDSEKIQTFTNDPLVIDPDTEMLTDLTSTDDDNDDPFDSVMEVGDELQRELDIDTDSADPLLDGSSDGSTLFEFEPVQRKDDLQQIFGIGPVTEQALNDLGITSYSQLAELKSHEIEKIAGALEIVPGRIERDDWVGNARRQLEDVLEEL